MLFRTLIVLMLPLFVFAEVSNIYRIGSASISVDGTNSVDGTLFGYKRHVVNGDITFAADINYITVESNTYGVDDTTEVMLHLGIMATDSLEIYGSYGGAYESENSGFGWGFGLVYDFSERFAVTYEYRKFDMDNYDLKSASLGLLIGF